MFSDISRFLYFYYWFAIQFIYPDYSLKWKYTDQATAPWLYSPGARTPVHSFFAPDCSSVRLTYYHNVALRILRVTHPNQPQSSSQASSGICGSSSFAPLSDQKQTVSAAAHSCKADCNWRVLGINPRHLPGKTSHKPSARSASQERRNTLSNCIAKCEGPLQLSVWTDIFSARIFRGHPAK